VVTTPAGSGTGTGIYTYLSPPSVVSITPTGGTIAGGTPVTVTGTSFSGATAVIIGGLAATGITIVNATTITAVTAAHAAGAVDIVVTTPGGTGTGRGLYTYLFGPTVTAVSPGSGAIAGGTAVTITGTSLSGASAIAIGGIAAGGITVVNATTVTAVTPAHAVGTVDVVVTTPGGVATGSGLYSYVGIPTVTAIDPIAGGSAGGTPITITGSSFIGASAVTIGGALATDITVVNAGTIKAVTAPHAAGVGRGAVVVQDVGAVDVVVTTPGGAGTGTGLYTYALLAAVPALPQIFVVLCALGLAGVGYFRLRNRRPRAMR
jgi:hypothetical protein